MRVLVRALTNLCIGHNTRRRRASGNALLLGAVRVEPHEVAAQHQGQDDDERVANHDGLERRVVLGRLAGEEELGSGNVARAVRDEEERGDCHLLGDALEVGLDQGHVEGQRGGARAEQKVRKELDTVVVDVAARVHDGGADDAGDDDGDDEQAVESAVAAGEPAREGDDGGAEKRVGDVDEGGLQRGKVEGLDDEVGEVLGAAVGDLRQDGNGKDEPRLGVDEALADLLPREARVLGAARAGHDDAADGDLALLRREEPGLGNVVGDEEVHGHRPDKGEDAEDDVHPAPGVHAVVDVADAKGEEGGDEAADGVAGEPDADAGGHLITGVPGGRQEHEGGRDGGLGDTQEEADGHEAAKVGACRSDTDNNTPEEGVEGEILADWDAGNEQRGRIFPDEVPKVENTADPAVLLPVEMLWRGISVCEL